MLDASSFVGPIGGALCLAYAAGWLSAEKRMRGWIKKIEADCASRDAERLAEIHELKADVARLNDFMLRGMERQLGQMRESAKNIVTDLGPST